MKLHLFRQSQDLPVSIDQAWDFFSRPARLAEITPKELGFENVYQSHDSLCLGMLIVHRIRLAPLIRLNWVSEIRYLKPGHFFIDEQRAGPYAFWQHRHRFESLGPEETRVHDEVHYALPFAPLSAPAHKLFVRPQLEKIFKFRHQAIASAIAQPPKN